MSLDALYQDVILDHYRHPHGAGLREPFDAEVTHVNPTCGDEVVLRVGLTGGRIADVSYDAVGCSISQASVSAMTDLVVGRTVAEAAQVTQTFVDLMHGRGEIEPDPDLLGDAVAFAGTARFPSRVKCALLGWMALRDATGRATATITATSVTEEQP